MTCIKMRGYLHRVFVKMENHTKKQHYVGLFWTLTAKIIVVC
jgi:hypothetical protein